MKVLVLGASGMAGHVIYTILEENGFDVLGTVNNNDFGSKTVKVNVFDCQKLEQLIIEFKPEMVINCIGMLIKGSKSNPEKAVYLNAYLPHLLDSFSRKYNFRFIHISTDCVFSGSKGSYIETDVKDAKDFYGQSKALGEVINDQSLTIRTSIIGPEIVHHGEGLFDWFMLQQNEINGYKSNFWSGITTLELAKFIVFIIQNPISGLYHLTNNTPISKFDLLNIFSRVYQKKINIISEVDYVCDKSFINTNSNVKYIVPSYLVMIEDQKQFMDKYMTNYKSEYFS